MDMGDVSEFERPPLRQEEIADLWKTYYKDTSPQDAALLTSKKLGCTIKDVCDALWAGVADASYFVPIIQAQAARGNFFHDIINEGVEDMGDISEFERPPLRNDEIARAWDLLWKGPESAISAARVISQEFQCSIERVCQAIEEFYTTEGKGRYFAGIIRAQAIEGNSLDESVEDDIGDVSEFERPLTKTYRVLYKGTGGDRRVVHIEAPDDVHAGQQIAAIPDFLPINLIEIDPMQEGIEDDIGDVGDYIPYGRIATRTKWPAVIKRIVYDLQHERGWDILEVHNDEDKRMIVNIINSDTGEIRQLQDAKADLLYSALDELGLLSRDTDKIYGSQTYRVYDIVNRKEETTMNEKKRWFEATEVSPESGYIKEVPDPVEDLGDVSEFEAPAQLEITAKLERAPSYYDAWKFFSTHFEDFRDSRAGVPYGSGAFEMWWVGASSPPDAAPSPCGTITKDDIDKLAREGGYQAEGSELFGLFMNAFYNNSLGAMMDGDTLVHLTQYAMHVASHIGGEEQFEGFDVFRDVPDDEREELMGTKYAARQIAAQIKHDAKVKLDRHRGANREPQANGGVGAWGYRTEN